MVDSVQPAERANQKWGDGGFIVDSRGNPIRSSPQLDPANHGGPSGPGDGGRSILQTEVTRDIPYLKAGVALLFALVAGSYIYFVDRIDTRFDRAMDKIERIDTQLTDLKAAGAGQSADLKAILEKVAERPAAPPSAKVDEIPVAAAPPSNR